MVPRSYLNRKTIARFLGFGIVFFTASLIFYGIIFVCVSNVSVFVFAVRLTPN